MPTRIERDWGDTKAVFIYVDELDGDDAARIAAESEYTVVHVIGSDNLYIAETIDHDKLPESNYLIVACDPSRTLSQFADYIMSLLPATPAGGFGSLVSFINSVMNHLEAM